MAHFAGIDVGSHTTRLLIIRFNGKIVEPIVNLRTITAIARGFKDSGLLSEDGKRKTLDTLKHYRGIIDEYGVESYTCGATGVFRKARDSAEFLSSLREETGIECRLLSEEDEALISFYGTILPLKRYLGNKIGVIFDLGGSTTEFVFSDEMNPLFWKSLPLGASTLTDAFFREIPAKPESLPKAVSFVNRKLTKNLGEAVRRYIGKKPLALIGTAGTVATLGAIKLEMEEYIPYRMCGLRLSREWISTFFNDILYRSLGERRKIKGLEKGREDIIVGGTLIVEQIMDFFSQDELIVSDMGLLEGLAIYSMENSMFAGLTWQFEPYKGLNNF